MVLAAEKVRILAESPDLGTGHLQPIIDFLKPRGNEPATGDAFYYNRDGYGVYGFAQPLNTQQLQEHFDFPPSISFYIDGLHDSHRLVCIQHTPKPPVRRFPFEK